MRRDLEIIAELINPQARILDLGCGDGSLLAHLQQEKQVNGYGLEIDKDNITRCVERGVNVLEQNLDRGLANFPDHSFDMVVMTETLQAVRNPHHIIDEMLRIGTQCIVTFPNFGYWKCRLALLRGRMPVSRALPHQWFDTPNIHLCTFADFERLCADQQVQILDRHILDEGYGETAVPGALANVLAARAIYRLSR